MQVERWDTYELSLNATGSYSNPFTEVSLTATFTHTSSGKSVTVSGFFDGGPVWRVRLMPTELGEWSYTTRSQDPGLDGASGSLLCVPPAKPYLHGPLQVDGYHFRHADGTRRYLISSRLSCQFASPNVWPRVISFLKDHRVNRVLFMIGGISGTVKDLYGPGPDFGRFNTVRFQAIDAFIDALRRADVLASPYFYYFNDGVQNQMTPEQDHAYIRYGMARFGAYANVMPVLSNQVEGKHTDQHAQYNLASHTWANEMGAYLREQAVFGLPVSVHNPLETENATRPSFYTLLQDWPFEWAHCMLRQAQVSALAAASEISDFLPEQKMPTYNARGYARHNQLLIDLRRFGVPMVNEEPGYEMAGWNWDYKTVIARPWNSQTSETLVPSFWTAVAAGAYAMWGNLGTYELDDPFDAIRKSSTPERLRILHDVVTALPYWEMEPANDLVSANEVDIAGASYRTNYCLAKRGECYLVFSLNGGAVILDLAPTQAPSPSLTGGGAGGGLDVAAGATYEVTQIDPRTGERRQLGPLKGARQTIGVAGREQVLVCRRVA